MNQNNTLKICKALIDFNIGAWCDFVLPKLLDVKYITIHNTSEPFSAFQERLRVQNRTDGLHTCFHFAVDESQAVQLLPLDRRAYHAGDGQDGVGNCESIAIEICRSACYGRDEPLYRCAELNAAMLCASLLKKYSLGICRVKPHRYWSGKFCPHRILSEKRWETFVHMVENCHDVAVEEGSGADSAVYEPIVMMRNADEWCDFRGRKYASQQDLIKVLMRERQTQIMVSAWRGLCQAYQALKRFQDDEISALGFYVPVKRSNDWLRKNIIDADELFFDYMNKLEINNA